MINFNNFAGKKNSIKRNSNWPHTLHPPYRILIIKDFVLEESNSLLDLIHHQPGIDKICLFAKDQQEAIYPLLFNKRVNIGLDRYYNTKDFIEYTNDMQNVYKNIEEYNSGQQHKLLIVLLI